LCTPVSQKNPWWVHVGFKCCRRGACWVDAECRLGVKVYPQLAGSVLAQCTESSHRVSRPAPSMAPKDRPPMPCGVCPYGGSGSQKGHGFKDREPNPARRESTPQGTHPRGKPNPQGNQTHTGTHPAGEPTLPTQQAELKAAKTLLLQAEQSKKGTISIKQSFANWLKKNSSEAILGLTQTSVFKKGL
jgi:hypothetical protein